MKKNVIAMLDAETAEYTRKNSEKIQLIAIQHQKSTIMAIQEYQMRRKRKNWQKLQILDFIQIQKD